MGTKNDELDMMAELFIDKQQEGPREYWIPPMTEDECIGRLEWVGLPKERAEALNSLILIYRSRNMGNGGKYTAEVRQNLIRLIEQNAQGFSANLLIKEGGYCEKARDYESATDFYLACIRAPKDDAKVIYFAYNNLGFCLNFLRRFSEAETYLREAISVCQERYNAWKNVGVSLEWQGQYEEAAGCYLRAIKNSRGEPRSHLHLRRLLDRHPSLKKIPCFSPDS